MEKEKNSLLAVVRVRGNMNLNVNVKRTLEQLNLHNKNWCTLVRDTPATRGMLARVKDYVTWGEATLELIEQMAKQRGDLFKSREKDSKSKIEYRKYIEIAGKKYNRFFRLSPPKKGYGKKGIKLSFSEGGALGYRAEKINDLLKRMI